MPAKYPHPLIAKEGWPFLAIGVAVSLAAGIIAGWCWSLPLWLLTLFVLQFFRDPPRDVPGDPRAVLARIQSGEYAKEFVLENRAGAPTLLSHRRMTAELQIEKVGARLREMMPWIRRNRLVDTSKN